MMEEESNTSSNEARRKQRCFPDEQETIPSNASTTPSAKQPCPIFTLGVVVGGSITCFITADDNNRAAITMWMAILWFIVGFLVLFTVVRTIVSATKEIEVHEYDGSNDDDLDTVVTDDDSDEKNTDLVDLYLT